MHLEMFSITHPTLSSSLHMIMSINLSAFNEVTESVSNRGTYDKLYLYNERIKIIQEKTGRANVSTRQLAASYKWVSVLLHV